MRDLINKLERIDERQNWDSLNAVIDQYAKTGMTLQDLAAMEQAARDVDENTGGIGGFFKGIASSESFRVNYVLYHAGEKLGLSTLIGTDGKIRTLDGGSYRSVKASSRSVQHRNLAVQQARINLLPQAVQTIFSIQQGGANAQLRPTQEFFYSPNARSLQGFNIATYRGKEPYADIVRQGQQTRVYFEEQYLEQFKAAYPNATVMKADGSGPLEAVAVDNVATVSTNNNNVEVTPLPNQEVQKVYDTLDDFANSDLGGLMNDKDQIPAIRELQTFLTTDLGLDTGTVDGAYGPKTTEAVRKFQSAIGGIAVDGNVGPETIAKIKEVKADIAKIEEIIRIILADSIIPFKSAIAKMLESRIDEAELTDEQREVLERLLGKYENFRTVFPEFKSELFTRASTAIGATTSNASDAGASDAGASDAGASDAGASDAGASDAGASDAGAEAEPAAEFPDIDAARIGIAELQPGDRVIIDGQEAIVDSRSDGGKYYQFSAPGPATDALAKDAGAGEPAYKELVNSALGPAYRVYDRDGNELSTGRGSGPNLPLAADWKEVNNIKPEVFISNTNDGTDALAKDADAAEVDDGGVTTSNNSLAQKFPNAQPFVAAASDAGGGEDTTQTNDSSEWKDITSGSAMIDGYSLWRKEGGSRPYAQTINGEQPNDNTEEYNIPAMAITAARRDKTIRAAAADEQEEVVADPKYEVVDGVREYSGDQAMTDAQQDTTLKTGDIIKIDGQEAEIYSVPPFNVIYWPGTLTPFMPGEEPPAAVKPAAEEGPLDWMNIEPHDARNRIWKFTVPEDKSNQITGIGVLQDNATVYLRQNQRRGRSVSGWMMARNPGFNAGKPLDSKQDPIVLKLISVLNPLGFDARGAIGLGMDDLGQTGYDILRLWIDAENPFSWDDAQLQDGINRIESREQMMSLLYAYRRRNNGKSLLDEFDDGSTIDDETKELLNNTFLKFNIPVGVEV